jgi:hypothetical protein
MKRNMIGRIASIVVGRLAVGVTVGLVLAAGVWIVDLVYHGESVVAAAWGQVEDSLGVLQALEAIGGLCGAVVGLLAGFRALASVNWSRPGPAASDAGTGDERREP